MVITDAQITAILKEVTDRFLIPHFIALGMNATGEWVNSLEQTASNEVGAIRGRHYSEYLQNGRRPGAMPPIAPLERWAQVKLGLSGPAAKSAAFAIAKKIAAEGTEYYKQGGTNLLDILESQEVLDYIRGEFSTILTVQARAEMTSFAREIFV